MGFEIGILSKVSRTYMSQNQWQMLTRISPDLRQRFVRSELALFKSRFETDDKNERAAFLQSLSFNYDTVGEDEKNLFKKELQQMLPKGSKEDAISETWFKVPWYTVPDLVGARRVSQRWPRLRSPVPSALSSFRSLPIVWRRRLSLQQRTFHD